MLQKMYAEQPEKFSTEELQTRYREMVKMDFDKSFYETCKFCLKELRHKTRNIDEQKIDFSLMLLYTIKPTIKFKRYVDYNFTSDSCLPDYG